MLVIRQNGKAWVGLLADQEWLQHRLRCIQYVVFREYL